MGSTLLITPVESLQERINETVYSFQDTKSIYVSLNKTQKSVEETLKKAGVDTKNIFFIDCATSEQTDERVLHISPKELDKLKYAIRTFIKEIKGRKSLLIDSLSTLLIYNSENRVAEFTKEITEYASDKNVEVFAISPETKGEDLLQKVFNFFNQVLER
jgi:archaellum biogenesis ATPase FlaH